MKAPALLFKASLAALITSFVVPDLSDLVLLAAPCTLASLILLLRASSPQPSVQRHRKSTAHLRPPEHSLPLQPDPIVQNWVILDGSNVMYWRNNTPDIRTVREVVEYLTEKGFTPSVMFDANAGYLLSDKFRNDTSLSIDLNLPADRVMVVPKGTPADPHILNAARNMGARVVSNDKFRDWAEEFPEVKTPGFLIDGQIRNEALWLALQDDA